MLLKLTNSDGKDVYINPESIAFIKESHKDPNAYYQQHSGTTVNINNSPSYEEPGKTTIQFTNNTQVYVEEHILEVIALLEGRDPKPARILYGKKKD